MQDKRLYLRLGDKVLHRDNGQWGQGLVVEEMTSRVPGGTCLVRIDFQDGRQRTFNNDLENETCGYYFGLRKLWDGDDEVFNNPGHRGAPRARRLPRM